jgi:hypothetical protein
MFISTLFAIAQLWNQSMCLSTNEWIKQMGHNIHNGALFSYEVELNYAIYRKMS